MSNQLAVNWNASDWQSVAAWAREELSGKRSKLEQVGLSASDGDVLRGEIKVLKNLLAQPELAAQVTPEADPNWV